MIFLINTVYIQDKIFIYANIDPKWGIMSKPSLIFHKIQVIDMIF
jgi:hypothetical protein